MNPNPNLKEARREKERQIIKSQLDAIDQQPLLANATIYYSRFGYLAEKWPECKGRKCINLVSKEEGDESSTIQPLFEYCKANPFDKVMYIHSKGTFTPTTKNDALRNMLMKAVTSTECVGMPSDGSCSACSSRNSAVPTNHFVGNMYIAQCEYIQKLIPPKDFGAAKARSVEKLKKGTRLEDPAYWKYVTDFGDGTKWNFWNTKWQLDRDPWMGVGRYAMEHWLGSHPDYQPCEVFGYEQKVTYELADTLDLANLEPRLHIGTTMSFTQYWGNIEDSTTLNPWFLRDGRLWEYKELYSKLPDKGHWMYSYLPSTADYHKETVAKRKTFTDEEKKAIELKRIEKRRLKKELDEKRAMKQQKRRENEERRRRNQEKEKQKKKLTESEKKAIELKRELKREERLRAEAKRNGD